MIEKIARLMNLSEEEYAEIIENAWRERDNTGFVFFEKRGENGKKEYLIKFRSQEGLNRFNNAVRAILEYKNPTEKFAEMINFSEERAEQIFSAAKKNSVFKVFLIEGSDSDYYKNYRLRFASRKDLNKFRKVCFPD